MGEADESSQDTGDGDIQSLIDQGLLAKDAGAVATRVIH